MKLEVTVLPGDVELFGTDPYYSARSWHARAQELLIALSELVGEIDRKISSHAYDDEAGLMELMNSVEMLNAEFAVEPVPLP